MIDFDGMGRGRDLDEQGQCDEVEQWDSLQCIMDQMG